MDNLSTITNVFLICFTPLILLLSILAGIRVGWRFGLTFAALGLGFLAAIGVAFLLLLMLVEVLPTTWLLPLLMTTAFIPALLLIIKIAVKHVLKKIDNEPLFKIEIGVEIKQKKLLMTGYASLMVAGPILFFSLVNQIISFPAIALAQIASLRLNVLMSVIWTLCSISILLNLRQRHLIKIYSNGILAQTGRFYKWTDIETYTWKFPDEYFQITLKNSDSKNTANIQAPHARKQEIIPYLEQYIKQHPESA